MSKEIKIIGNCAKVIIKKVESNHEYFGVFDGVPNRLMSIVNPKALMKASRI